MGLLSPLFQHKINIDFKHFYSIRVFILHLYRYDNKLSQF